jgi:hypothetical protein
MPIMFVVQAGPDADHGNSMTTSTGSVPFGLMNIKDAAALLSDFWAEVDAVLEERGVI